MNQPKTVSSGGISELWKKEDWWAVWLGMGIVIVALIFWAAGGSLKSIAISVPSYDAFSAIPVFFAEKIGGLIGLFIVLIVVFSIAVKILGHDLKEFIPGFIILFLLAVLVQVLGSWNPMKEYNLEAPVLALIIGMILGNFIKTPQWLDTSLRTEFYVKTGIVLLGATLPFTLIMSSGPVAFLQATIIAVTTWLVIYFVGTRFFGLDKRFAATLGAGGSICGVSASIAVGSSVNAESDHVSISIALVVIYATIMVFLLPILIHALGLPDGPAGAWIGTSEFADAAGMAAAAQISDKAVESFTLMKVVGRDMFIGVWCFILAIISVTKWEKREEGTKPDAKEIWFRFPKFVLGFFVASILMTLVIASVDPSSAEIINSDVTSPVKTLRTWCFVLCFLCIGLTTRFKELAKAGLKPFLAFTTGVLVNVPLGYIFSVLLLGAFWASL
jgi:uncharacterized integral membrane protein (TIGR00698 family)